MNLRCSEYLTQFPGFKSRYFWGASLSAGELAALNGHDRDAFDQVIQSQILALQQGTASIPALSGVQGCQQRPANDVGFRSCGTDCNARHPEEGALFTARARDVTLPHRQSPPAIARKATAPAADTRCRYH